MVIFPGKQIALNRVMDLEISTVELPRFNGDDQVRYETCIFPDNGLSNVVGRYNTIEEAHHFHNAVVKHETMHRVAKIQQPNG
jgi:hypothetical protein